MVLSWGSLALEFFKNVYNVLNNLRNIAEEETQWEKIHILILFAAASSSSSSFFLVAEIRQPAQVKTSS